MRAFWSAAALLATLCPALAQAAPMAEVWPYQVKRTDGGVEYAYDLTTVKASGGTPDAKADSTPEVVAGFLKNLPREVKVFVKTGAPLFVSAARGVEDAPLATSFAGSPDGPLASDDPLRRKPKARMRPALDPDEPKVLPAAEMVLWRVQRLWDGALAAAELDSDRLRKAWLSQLLDRAQARVRTEQGDAREGALMLAARISVALSCLDPARLSAKGDIAKDAKVELEAMRKDPNAMTPPGFYAWTPELTCIWRRSYVLGQPFEMSRGGYAAPLTMLVLLTDPKAKATWVKLRGRRDALFGGPKIEPLQAYLERSGNDPNGSLDDLVTAIDAWSHATPPELMAAPKPPFQDFLGALQGAERLQAVEELSAAVADGRITLPQDANAPVLSLQQAALGALCAEDIARLQIDAAWRDQRQGAFCALLGAHHDLRESNFELPSKDAVRNELKIALEVPPVIDVEPAPLVYRRAAVAAGRLAAVLGGEGLSAVVDPEGNNSDGAAGQLKHWQQVLSGLASLSTPGDGAENADTAAARAFVSGWRADPVLGRDVRFAAAGPVSFEGERTHAVVQGVARRELAVSFAEPPTTTIIGGPTGFVADLKAEQRYLVPVLLTTSYRAPATQLPLSFKEVRKAIDAAGRQPAQVPAAIAELSGGSRAP